MLPGSVPLPSFMLMQVWFQAQEHWVSLGKYLFGKMRPEVDDAVPPCPLAGKDTGTAGCAYRGGYKGICKSYTSCCQGVHIRRLDNGIAGTAHRVGSMVIGQ